MLTQRFVGALTFAAAIVSAAIGCAPPTPGEEVGGSLDPLSGGVPRMTGATAAYNPATATVTETVRFREPGQGARVCHAYLNGTAAQKAACDNYPNGYSDMSCIDWRESGNSPRAGYLYTECQGGGRLGAAPFDQGDGNYRVVFVNKNDPSDTRITSVNLTSDFFLLKIRGRNYPPYVNAFGGTQFYGVPTGGVTTPITDSLELTIEVRRDLVSQVKGCAGAFSTDGLTPAEVAAKDADLLNACAQPTERLDGREGWSTFDARPNINRAELEYNVTPFVTPKQHIVFVFEVSGNVRRYIFESD
jgi:hypothetical protein